MAEINLDLLKQLWNKEKDFYRTAEVGSGVQKFVKKVFHCSELFNLKEGAGSTEDINRENEFIEEAKKKRRMADIVVFIDSDVVVPVEVERFGNIKAGIQQLYNYQADWVKKLGILTDGNEWRFYNNKYIEKVFLIDKVLDDPTEFLTFWQEYITPEFYYLSFYEKKGQQQLFEEDIPHLDDAREDFFKDITKLIENFKNKLNLKGYFQDVEDPKEREKKAVEITYAYLIQFMLYKTLVDNSFADFEDDWKERLKTINRSLHSQSYGEILQKIQGISRKISQNIYKRFSDEQEIINNHLEDILAQPKNDIKDVSVWLDIILFINRYDFSNVKNEIFGYVYENYLKDLYLDEKKGQYFTDPLVVDFMLDEIGYTESNLQKRFAKEKDSLSIIDPSCGSGTFLYNATNRLVEAFFKDSEESSKLVEELINKNIFGLDIAEFPLYLAEMNILMRMLPLVINERYNNPVDQKIKVFKTRDSIAEFLDTVIGDKITNAEYQGQMSLFSNVLDLGYDSYVRDKQDLDELKSSFENVNGIPRSRFDFVIGNPPYVGYNECSKQELLFVKLIQDRKLLMSDIYGVNLNTVPGRIKAYAPKPNLYSFFIALGLALLKDGGKICYIIPQTILTSTDLDVIRHHLAKYTTINKIITFSGQMFIGRGIKQNKPIPTSSLIFIISKKNPEPLHKIEIINYNNSNEEILACLDNIRAGKHISLSKIDQTTFLKRAENWNFIKFSTVESELIIDYEKKSESMDVYREYKISRKRFNDIFIIDGSYNFPTKEILTSPTDNKKHYDIPIFDNKFYRINQFNYYPKDANIRVAKGGQGYKVAETLYKVIWHYIKPTRFFFIDENDNVLPKFQQYCIGSNNRTEILYLFALLNSPVTNFILEKYLRSENEKDLLIGVKVIKEYIRVPQIIDLNKNIKTKIVSEAEKLIDLENFHLYDLVDFKGVLQQKFDSVEVQGNKFVICYKNNCVKCNINGNAVLLQQIIDENLSSLVDENGVGSISELKKLPVVNFPLQKQIKDYIDDLVFALYFKIDLPAIGFSNREEVQADCEKHKYYKLINQK